METIEKREPVSAGNIIEHMRGELYGNTRRALARNRDLKNEVSQRPGAEMYSLDLEKMKRDIEDLENKF